jgi:hypothetical protein
MNWSSATRKAAMPIKPERGWHRCDELGCVS